MNETTHGQVSEQASKGAALPALITLDPQQYTAAVYAPLRAQFETAKASIAEVSYDITTAVGMRTAVECRAKFRDLRISAEKARKDRKAPILEIGKLLDSRYKEFEAEVEPLELRFDKDIKAEETRKENERAERARKEQERIESIQKEIAGIRGYADKAVGLSSTHVGDLTALLLPLVIAEERFAEFTPQAKVAKAETLERLNELRRAASDQEAEQERIRLEREELARLRAEQAERDRIDAERRAEEERKAREARETEEQRLRDERRKLDEERAQQAQVDRLAREAREAEEKQLADQRAELLRGQQELLRQQEALKSPAEPAPAAVTAEQAPVPEPDLVIAAEPAAEQRSNVVSMQPRPREGRPSDMQLISTLALHYRVHESKVIEWLLDMDLGAASQKVAANL